MASFLYADLPRKVNRPDYERAMERFLELAGTTTGLAAVYGLGSVAHPGISDLDVLLVFEDETSCATDFRKKLNSRERYCFIHAPYGTSRSLLLEGQPFTFYRPYRLLLGNDILFGANFEQASPLVRNQVALEYLIRFYLGISMQRAYRQLRVRSLLLNAKGAGIDLMHLVPHDLDARRLLDRLTVLRENWFDGRRPPLQQFTAWFDDLYGWFDAFMHDRFRDGRFFLPENRTFSIARNLHISGGDAFRLEAQVRRLPLLKPLTGKKYFNILNRLSRFELQVPFEFNSLPKPIVDYFDYNERHRHHNRLHLPGCLPLTNSFHLR